MNRPATAFGALAFLWACAATVHLLVVSGQARVATSTMLAAGVGMPEPPLSLATATGVWMTGLLMCVTWLAGMPLGFALSHPAAQRLASRTVGFLVLGFCILSGSSVGLPYVPAAILLLLAGGAGRVEPRDIRFVRSGTSGPTS